MSSIARQADGRWRARYRDATGREHARHFGRKVDAQRWLDGVTAALATGSCVDPRTGRLTVGEWADRWLSGQGQLQPTTRARYRGILDGHVLPRWAEHPLRLGGIVINPQADELTGQELAELTIGDDWTVWRPGEDTFTDLHRLAQRPPSQTPWSTKAPAAPVHQRRRLRRRGYRRGCSWRRSRRCPLCLSSSEPARQAAYGTAVNRHERDHDGLAVFLVPDRVQARAPTELVRQPVGPQRPLVAVHRGPRLAALEHQGGAGVHRTVRRARGVGNRPRQGGPHVWLGRCREPCHRSWALAAPSAGHGRHWLSGRTKADADSVGVVRVSARARGRIPTAGG